MNHSIMEVNIKGVIGVALAAIVGAIILFDPSRVNSAIETRHTEMAPPPKTAFVLASASANAAVTRLYDALWKKGTMLKRPAGISKGNAATMSMEMMKAEHVYVLLDFEFMSSSANVALAMILSMTPQPATFLSLEDDARASELLDAFIEASPVRLTAKSIQPFSAWLANNE